MDNDMRIDVEIEAAAQQEAEDKAVIEAAKRQGMQILTSEELEAQKRWAKDNGERVGADSTAVAIVEALNVIASEFGNSVYVQRDDLEEEIREQMYEELSDDEDLREQIIRDFLGSSDVHDLIYHGFDEYELQDFSRDYLAERVEEILDSFCPTIDLQISGDIEFDSNEMVQEIRDHIRMEL